MVSFAVLRNARFLLLPFHYKEKAADIQVSFQQNEFFCINSAI
ncbi:hypothetical protein B4134_0439 [Bacillus safensis]|nr:hypothetical protein B4134_0439 [Bacillus safensis]